MDPMVALQELEVAPALEPGDRGLVHQVMEALVSDVVEAEGSGRDRRQHQAERDEPGGGERPHDQHPGHDVDGDQRRPAPPREGEGLLLLLVMDMKGVVELAELVVDERVGGEAILREPGSMEPVTMECPLEEACLHGGYGNGGNCGEDFQKYPPRN